MPRIGEELPMIGFDWADLIGTLYLRLLPGCMHELPGFCLVIGCHQWVPPVPVIWDWVASGAEFPGIGVELS